MKSSYKPKEKLLNSLATLRRRITKSKTPEPPVGTLQRSSKGNAERIMDCMLEGCQVIGLDWRYLYVNDAAASHGRYPKNQLLGKIMMEMYPGIENTEMFVKLRNCMEKRTPHRMENEFTFADGARGWFELSMEPVSEGVLIFSWDITGRKQAEEKLLHLYNILLTIRKINQLIVEVDDEDRLLHRACNILVDGRNYKMAWIGFISEGSYDVLPVAQAGFEDGYLSSLKITWDESKYGKGKTGTAINTRRPLVMQDIVNDERYAPWREEGLKRGYASSAALPLIIGNKVIGALSVYSGKPDAFDEAEINMLVELAGDISLGIQKIRQREVMKRMLQELEIKGHLLDAAKDSVFVYDLEGKFIYINEIAYTSRGYSRNELMVTNRRELCAPEYRTLFESRMRKIEQEGELSFECVHLRKDGTTMPVEIHARTVKVDGKTLVLSIARDITERKNAEAQLQGSEKKYSTLVERSNDGIIIIQDALVKFANSKMVELTGFSLEEALGKSFIDFVSPEHREFVVDSYTKRVSGEEVPNSYEIEIRSKDGRKIPVEINASRIEYEGRLADMAIVRDITERKRAEDGIKQSQKTLQTIIDSMPFGIIAIGRDDRKIYRANNAALSLTGYQSEDEVIGRECNKVLCPAEAFQCPVLDLGQELDMSERILLTKDGGSIPVLKSAIPVTIDNKNALLEAFVDITERKQAEEERRESTQKLLNAMKSTVEIMALTTEMRDPYTAGHQRRVADLACAIAKEMGLEADRIEGIRLAGIIHDIGKVSVPVEILSKPGALSDIEFSMIKTHCKAGYDILKTIEFPWPIAQIVLQHHSRLDGSGYPDCAKDQEFILESRILAVADVVEAMASHRPYRPALGIGKALEEISQKKGMLYDQEVVDACMQLFYAKGFTLA